MIEIKLDQATLPKDGQKVLFKVVTDELEKDSDKTHIGRYFAKNEEILAITGLVYDMWSEVICWEPLDSYFRQRDESRHNHPANRRAVCK